MARPVFSPTELARQAELPSIWCRGRGRRGAEKKKVLWVKHWSHSHRQQRCEYSASSEKACLPCSPPRVGMWAGMLLRQLCTRKKASLIGKGRLSLSSRSPSLHLNPMCLELEEGAIVTYWFPVLSGHVSVCVCVLHLCWFSARIMASSQWEWACVQVSGSVKLAWVRLFSCPVCGVWCVVCVSLNIWYKNVMLYMCAVVINLCWFLMCFRYTSVHIFLSYLKMATGNSPSGIDPPSPSPRGGGVPAKAIGEHFSPIPVPRGELVPDGDPRTRR